MSAEKQKIAREKFAEFFQNRDGLRVYNRFYDSVVSRAALAEAVEAKYFDLPRTMLDQEIQAELGGKLFFTEGLLCANLQKMLEEQWGGKPGPLLNNGSGNLFYTYSRLVVDVRLFADYSFWLVDARERDPCLSGPGERVFYLPTDTSNT